MKRTIIASIIAVFITASAFLPADACTNFLVTKGASTDGSTMISYAADSHVLYGELYFRPAATYPAGTMVKVYEWDTGKYLGEIAQAERTYSVVGNMNEHQVAIGETTYGGRSELRDTTGLVDYGSLIYLTLQRAKSAREAIKTMIGLVTEYGYYSSGESFSIADKDEVWIMEIIGKGVGNKGVVWVARQIPDGYVSAHANQARITTFPFQKENDWFNKDQTTFHAPDVISLAREKGYWKGEDKDFSFSDVYAPVGFGSARFCEIRVWSFFKDINNEMEKHFDYASGKVEKNEQGIATNRMPLWVKPDEKIAAHDVMNYMRDHLEGTPLDMRKDLGAGPFGNPYRWRPLTWEVDSVTYCNERATATQQTGFSFVTQSRNWLPDPVGGLNWFGVDDAATSVYVPFYCGVKEIPEAFREGNGDLFEFSETSAFWIFNMVTNFAYSRYDRMKQDIDKVRMKLDDKYIKETQKVDQKAKDLYQTSPYRAIKYITDYSVGAGQEAFNTWKELFQYLTIKYIDGNIKKEKDGEFLTNGTGVVVGPEQPGYPESWYRRIVEETGDQFLMLDQENLPEKKEQAAMVTISKTNMNIMIGAIVILGLIVLVMLFRKRK
jgi:dipeptidase